MLVLKPVHVPEVPPRSVTGLQIIYGALQLALPLAAILALLIARGVSTVALFGLRRVAPVRALATAAVVTIGLVLALGIFHPRPRYLVPVGGMVIGNAMTAAAVSLNRLADEIRGSALRIEATLALGATSWEASRDLVTRSLRSGMITLIDSTKTTGIVFFPGTMVGMLLAGARPLDAVRLQLILLWSLLGSVALSSVLATGLGYRGFFTPAHQLRDLEDGGS